MFPEEPWEGTKEVFEIHLFTYFTSDHFTPDYFNHRVVLKITVLKTVFNEMEAIVIQIKSFYIKKPKKKRIKLLKIMLTLNSTV